MGPSRASDIDRSGQTRLTNLTSTTGLYEPLGRSGMSRLAGGLARKGFSACLTHLGRRIVSVRLGRQVGSIRLGRQVGSIRLGHRVKLTHRDITIFLHGKL
ncbi:hypothetical protein DEO72_LG3g124 [Vigna unguiculata]|uniref:Uncharacterized protein n=1 Tax=Vigna unguiculata TaxID=3917 RepID=A0A4D6LB66_VIGUN|nr:hypothetical protein DEO72_LG3g124 [Vigna unguiculata]